MSGTHFYTTYLTEVNEACRNAGFRFEQVAGYVYSEQQPGTVPLYRLYKGAHFYTTSEQESAQAQNDGWTFEQVACYVHPEQQPGTVPLNRYYNSGANDHFYTTYSAESGAPGYAYEGIACFVYPVMMRGTVPLYRMFDVGDNSPWYLKAYRFFARVVVEGPAPVILDSLGVDSDEAKTALVNSGPEIAAVIGSASLAIMDTSQDNWRWCHKCQGLHFAGNPSQGSCPAGGEHENVGSGNYSLVLDSPSFPGQDNWRWCHKCQGLHFAGSRPPRQSSCPAGGEHETVKSGNYSLTGLTH